MSRIVILLLLLISVLALSVRALGLEDDSQLYYGRVWGTVLQWKRNDQGDSHHLELSFAPVKDLDTGASYSDFQANVDVRSYDGSSMLYALVNGSALNKTGLVNKATSTPVGLKKLADPTAGVQYESFLDASDFTVIDEDALVALLSQWLKDSRLVYLWGQVYHDPSGAVGIHDIHRIEGDSYKGYGDGAFISQSKSGDFQGIFMHFNNQPVVAQ